MRPVTPKKRPSEQHRNASDGSWCFVTAGTVCCFVRIEVSSAKGKAAEQPVATDTVMTGASLSKSAFAERSK
jgi:hypothetical protein